MPRRRIAMYQDGWLTINGLSTHVLTWGGWVQHPLPESDHLILFMCGVPGITLFYQHFLDALYNLLHIPIWTISIAGHELPPSSTNLKMDKDERLYNNVKAQIAHKLSFIREYVPKDCKIYLIGHSFGAKMVTELLKDKEIKERVQKSLLLMPTIERFKDTPRAQFWLKMCMTGLIYAIVGLFWVVSLLPLSLQKAIIKMYFQSRGLNSVPECCTRAMVHFCNPTIFYNVRMLLWDELQAIDHLDTEVLTDLQDKTKVYFAPDDYWAPLTHCQSLHNAVPGLCVEMLDRRFMHAFTLDAAEDMALILAKELKTEPLQSYQCL